MKLKIHQLIRIVLLVTMCTAQCNESNGDKFIDMNWKSIVDCQVDAIPNNNGLLNKAENFLDTYIVAPAANAVNEAKEDISYAVDGVKGFMYHYGIIAVSAIASVLIVICTIAICSCCCLKYKYIRKTEQIAKSVSSGHNVV